MATFTGITSLRKSAGTDFVSRTLDLNNNWDIVDALFDPATGHFHSGSGTSGRKVSVAQNDQVVYDPVEAATLDALSGSSKLINNLNRIRFWLSQISGEAVGTVTVNLATHVAAGTAHGISGFATPAITLSTAASAGSGTNVLRHNASIAAFNDAANPVDSLVGDTTSTGAVNFAARRDHRHARESFGSPVGISVSNADGAATTVARSNHVHAHGSLAAIANAHAAADITNAAALNVVNTFIKQYAVARVNKTFSATPTFDWNDSNMQSMTLTGSITGMTFNNPIDGGRYVLIFTQDATGGRTIVWPASFHWSGGAAPTLSAANKIDSISLVYQNGIYLPTIAGAFAP